MIKIDNKLIKKIDNKFQYKWIRHKILYYYNTLFIIWLNSSFKISTYEK